MRTRDKVMVWLAVGLVCFIAYNIAWKILAFWWRGNPGSLAFTVGMGILVILAGICEE